MRVIRRLSATAVALLLMLPALGTAAEKGAGTGIVSG
jgi:hypothetical protein